MKWYMGETPDVPRLTRSLWRQISETQLRGDAFVEQMICVWCFTPVQLSAAGRCISDTRAPVLCCAVLLQMLSRHTWSQSSTCGWAGMGSGCRTHCR